MARVIKLKGSKRKQQDKIYFNELIDVEEVGQMRVKIDSKLGERFATHFDALKMGRGIKNIDAQSYDEQLNPNDKIVKHYYNIELNLKGLDPVDALAEAKSNAYYHYYMPALSAAQTSAMFISLLDDNFVIETEGENTKVSLKKPLNQVEIDPQYFVNEDDDMRHLSYLPKRSPRYAFVPEEQIMAIIESIQLIDNSFSKQLSQKMEMAFELIREGKLVTSDEEVDENGFQPTDVDGDSSPETESVSMES